MIWEIALILAVSFLITFASVRKVMPKLRAAGIVGNDMNKPGRGEVAEMGGIAIVMGFVGAVLVAIAMRTFLGFSFDLVSVLAAMMTVLIVALIGIFDDMFDMSQRTKALLPLVAAIPLIAVQVTTTSAINFPFLGSVDFGIFYLVALIPIAIAVCSNLTNMLAGFNGLEAGMGLVMFLTIGVLALNWGAVEMGLLSSAMLGALLAFLLFNWHPAKIFMGDIGTLSIGTVLATAVIIGNFKVAGAILVIPYVLDFFIKLANGFPSRDWWGEYREGKLHAPHGRVRGLCQLAMKISGGVGEQRLVLMLIGAEAVFGAIALALYLRV